MHTFREEHPLVLGLDDVTVCELTPLCAPDAYDHDVLCGVDLCCSTFQSYHNVLVIRLVYAQYSADAQDGIVYWNQAKEEPQWWAVDETRVLLELCDRAIKS